MHYLLLCWLTSLDQYLLQYGSVNNFTILMSENMAAEMQERLHYKGIGMGDRYSGSAYRYCQRLAGYNVTSLLLSGRSGSALLVNMQLMTGIIAIIGHIFPVLPDFVEEKELPLFRSFLALKTILTLCSMGYFWLYYLPQVSFPSRL